MKKFRIYQVDAFTKTMFTGNPAGVVSNADGLSAPEMQNIARELNVSETAFLLNPDGPDHDVVVRFFTPTVEVPSCGHATVAAHFVRAIENDIGGGSVQQKTKAGIQKITIRRNSSDPEITIHQGPASFEPELQSTIVNDVLAALTLSPADRLPGAPIQVVSTGHSKVLIGIRETPLLHKIKPDLDALKKLSRIIGSNGFHIFSLGPGDSDFLAHGRMFAPAIGINEDPVTGNANGPLGAYLVRHQLVKTNDTAFGFRAKQGEAMGRPGIVHVEVQTQPNGRFEVSVGKDAVIVFRADLTL